MELTHYHGLILLLLFILGATLFTIIAARRQGKKWVQKNFPELEMLQHENLSPSTKKILRIQLLKRENNWYAGRINFNEYLDEETKESLRWLIGKNEKLINKMSEELSKGDYS